jgi:hypothetical protein
LVYPLVELGGRPILRRECQKPSFGSAGRSPATSRTSELRRRERPHGPGAAPSSSPCGGVNPVRCSQHAAFQAELNSCTQGYSGSSAPSGGSSLTAELPRTRKPAVRPQRDQPHNREDGHCRPDHRKNVHDARAAQGRLNAPSVVLKALDGRLAVCGFARHARDADNEPGQHGGATRELAGEATRSGRVS